MNEKTILSDITLATNIARSSPSSHNCQPWKIHILNEDELPHTSFHTRHLSEDSACLQLQFDKQRLLNTLPSLQAEMYVSCGGFYALFSDALRDLGYSLTEHWIDNDNSLLDLQIYRTDIADKQKLCTLKRIAQKRKTNRGMYKQLTTSEEKLQSLFPNYPLVSLNIIQAEKDIQHIAHLVKVYSSLDFSNKAVWEETYSYIRFNDEQPAEDGFYLHNLFGPVSPLYKQLFRFGLHPNNHWLYNSLGIPKVMAKGLAELVANTSQLITISIDSWDSQAQFNAGKALNTFWRNCAEANLAIHPLSVLLQNDEPKQHLQEALQYNKPLVFIARIGIPESSASESPRRSVESILDVADFS